MERLPKRRRASGEAIQGYLSPIFVYVAGGIVLHTHIILRLRVSIATSQETYSKVAGYSSTDRSQVLTQIWSNTNRNRALQDPQIDFACPTCIQTSKRRANRPLSVVHTVQRAFSDRFQIHQTILRAVGQSTVLHSHETPVQRLKLLNRRICTRTLNRLSLVPLSSTW